MFFIVIETFYLCFEIDKKKNKDTVDMLYFKKIKIKIKIYSR
jgi:hypothetical protein